MDLKSNQTAINSSTSTSYCRHAPIKSWEVEGSALYLIIGLVSVMASFPTIILNGSVILAIKRKKELQKPSHIIMSSLAITDLLVGATVMPISATIDFIVFRQVSFESTCMLYAVNLFLFSLLYGATMHHLTIIAWERYVAIQKWKDYKRIITKGRLKKIAIGTWLSDIFLTVAYFTTTVVVVNRIILDRIFAGWTALETTCLFLVVYFYRKVYLGIRNRKLNEISQIHVLVKGKLESKIAKTTGLVTAAFIFSFLPIFVYGNLGNFMPVFRTNAAIQLTQTFAQMNSLFNPLLYCYRDQRFRNANRELLGLKKPQAIQPAAGARFFRRKYSVGSLEHPKVEKRMRSVSCNLINAFDSFYGKSSVVMMNRSLSAPTLDTCSNYLNGFNLQRPLSTRGNKCNEPCQSRRLMCN